MVKGYEEFISFMQSLNHPSYEIDGIHYQWSLNIMNDFNAFLNFPANHLKIIHVGGTNGKGSCSNFIASILSQAGLKVGVYGSPQLYNIRERIKINGTYICEEEVAEFYEKIKAYISVKLEEDKNCDYPVFNSYSEILVSMAFDYFYTRKVDVAVIEVGIGGINDPTNIIDKPLLSVITSIGLDHTEIFGNSINRIAHEKSGIIKKKIPVVVGSIDEELKSFFSDKAHLCGSEIYFVDNIYDELGTEFKTVHTEEFDLLGDYQKINIKTVSCAIYALLRHHKDYGRYNLLQNMHYALKNTSSISNFHGRWEIINDKPLVIVDVCSNSFGLKINIRQLESMMKSEKYERLVIIIGLSSMNHIFVREYLPAWAHYIYTEDHSFLSARELAEKIGYPGKICDSVEKALQSYVEDIRNTDLVYIGGHIWVAAEALKLKEKFFV